MHGRLVYFHFGSRATLLRINYGVVFGGFAIKDGIVTFDSSTLNCSILQGPNGAHDYLNRKMS